MHPGIPPSKWRIVLIPSAFFGLALCQAFFVGPQPIGQARITPKRRRPCPALWGTQAHEKKVVL